MVIHPNTHPVTDGEEQPQQGEEEGKQMNDDRCGHTRDEIEDEARHAYANGTVVLRAIADEISEITLNGLTIRRCKLDLLLDQLYEIYELLGDRTVWSMGDDPAIDADEDAVDAYRDTYSDGTPVSMVVGPPRSRGWSVPCNDDEYSCGIPSLPNATRNDGYAEYGLIPPGCKVVVLDPPHRRMSKAWAARQDGGSAFKDLKARLLEAER
jgi:hypothetical protein